MRPYLACCLLAACAAPGPSAHDPNAGLLRDFLDGKFDGAGHPVNAKVLDGQTACGGTPTDGGVVLGAVCVATLPEGATQGGLTVNVRLRVRAHASSGPIVTVALLDDSGATLASEQLTTARLRDAATWLDLPVALADGQAAKLQITPAPGAAVDLAYAEVFPTHFGIVLSPGSGVLDDSAHLTLEIPLSRPIDSLVVDGIDLTSTLAELITDGVATQQSTAFRTLDDVAVADLLPDRGDVSELMLHAGETAARLQIRRSAAACQFAGDPSGKKVIITGFQPFPADGWHDNVSGVAVTAMDPTVLHGAQVMKLVMPVEYDDAAAIVTDAIARCQPDVVISFGQGGDDLALEHVAYNLQDTGEISGGVPDNRGIIRAAQPIDSAAPATRDTLLPLDAIEAALVAIGEAPQPSTDPGRYVCNNVMFADLGAMTGKHAGFIHLPYTTDFDDATTAHFGKIVETAVQATVDAIE